MAKFVQSNYKKIILTLIIVITLPIWLTLLNFIFDFIIQAGRITGTFIRIIGSGNICAL